MMEFLRMLAEAQKRSAGGMVPPWQTPGFNPHAPMPMPTHGAPPVGAAASAMPMIPPAVPSAAPTPSIPTPAQMMGVTGGAGAGGGVVPPPQMPARAKGLPPGTSSGDPMVDMLYNPLFQMGMGILSENTKPFGGDPFGAATRGLMAAQDARVFNEERQRQKDERERTDRARVEIRGILSDEEKMSSVEPQFREMLGVLADVDPQKATELYGQVLRDKANRAARQGNMTPRAQAYLQGTQPPNPAMYTPESYDRWQQSYDQALVVDPATGMLDIDPSKIDNSALVPVSKEWESTMNAAESAAFEASTNAQNMFGIAQRYEDFARTPEGRGLTGAGLGAWLKGKGKEVLGMEDPITEMRTTATRLRNNAVVQGLPPGVASDRDVALVLEGYMSPNANPATFAGHMRGLAKLEAVVAAYEQAKTRYIEADPARGTRGFNGFWEQNKDHLTRMAIERAGGYNTLSAEEYAARQYGPPTLGAPVYDEETGQWTTIEGEKVDGTGSVVPGSGDEGEFRYLGGPGAPF